MMNNQILKNLNNLLYIFRYTLSRLQKCMYQGVKIRNIVPLEIQNQPTFRFKSQEIPTEPLLINFNNDIINFDRNSLLHNLPLKGRLPTR